MPNYDPVRQIPPLTRRQVMSLRPGQMETHPFEYLTTLAQCNMEAIGELGDGLLSHDRDLVKRACRRLESIAALARTTADSL